MNDLKPTAIPHQEYEERHLEKLRVALYQRISRELPDAQIEVMPDYLSRDILLRFEHYVWSEQVDKIRIEYPADWWQAFKERWFPEWLRKKYPVEHKVHRIDVKALYPDFKYATRESRCIVALMEEPNWKFYP